MSINNPLNIEISPLKFTPLPRETLFDKKLNTEDMALFQHQWDIFNQLKTKTVIENPLQKNKQEIGVELPQGTLLHGTRYDLEKLQKIKELGIVSGELVGIPEDNETHYCADFFRVPENMSIAQYLDWSRQIIFNGTTKSKRGEFDYLPIPRKRSPDIALIVDTSDSRLQPLIAYDAYGPDSHKRMESIINSLPRDIDLTPSRTTAAILVGIPSNFISGIIVSDVISEEEITKIKQTMGKQTLVYKTTGEVI